MTPQKQLLSQYSDQIGYAKTFISATSLAYSISQVPQMNQMAVPSYLYWGYGNGTTAIGITISLWKNK